MSDIDNEDVRSRIEGYKYWDIFAEDIEKIGDREVLADIEDLMTNVVDDVTERAKKEGKDPAQARKNAAGRYFQAIVSYATAETAADSGLKILHDKDLSSTELSGAVPLPSQDELDLSPDADIVYYNPDEDDGPAFILSCKTSFRERMSQTGMWKLLFESTSYECSDPDCPTHEFSFPKGFDRDIYMGFATPDFYNDVGSKGIVDLFDFGYAPESKLGNASDNVYPLTELMDHIENEWSGFR